MDSDREEKEKKERREAPHRCTLIHYLTSDNYFGLIVVKHQGLVFPMLI